MFSSYGSAYPLVATPKQATFSSEGNFTEAVLQKLTVKIENRVSEKEYVLTLLVDIESVFLVINNAARRFDPL